MCGLGVVEEPMPMAPLVRVGAEDAPWRGHSLRLLQSQSQKPQEEAAKREVPCPHPGSRCDCPYRLEQPPPSEPPCQVSNCNCKAEAELTKHESSQRIWLLTAI